MTQIGRQYLWPDTAGTPTDAGVAFTTVGAGPVYDIELETELVLWLAATGGTPRSYEVMVEVTLDGTNWAPWYINNALSSFAATATLGMTVSVPPRCQIRVSARRFGGSGNSMLTIMGLAREAMPAPVYNGQPLPLVTHHEDGIECWGDGAGGHDHPAAGPGAHAPAPAGAGAQLIIPTGEADTLVIEYTVGALAATTIEFLVQESVDGGVTYRALPAVNSVTAGVISTSIGQEQPTGALGTWITREIAVRPGTLIRVDAQRTGGGANTTLLAYARLYHLGR